MKIGDIGVLAIYAPNTAVERIQLWENLASSLDNTRACIVLGDFNMITEARDQTGGREKANRETSEGNSSSGSEDTTETESEGMRVMKRLDRIYASEEIADKMKTYEIFEGSILSDHAPVQASLCDGSRRESKTSRFCMNVSLLKEAEFKATVVEAWKLREKKGSEKREDPELTLRKCLRNTRKLMKARGKQVAKDKRAKKEEKT
ncbi:hypothetical protein R1sor_005196 [Riccia sorocarpa]|uniref:Endonuclease/exonuclease/phosphatase domain-containing protein n=1 Tax=Riccia sorocarpa TaxID=122646 RepID=A0ABD3HIV0_9MARC